MHLRMLPRRYGTALPVAGGLLAALTAGVRHGDMHSRMHACGCPSARVHGDLRTRSRMHSCAHPNASARMALCIPVYYPNAPRSGDVHSPLQAYAYANAPARMVVCGAVVMDTLTAAEPPAGAAAACLWLLPPALSALRSCLSPARDATVGGLLQVCARMSIAIRVCGQMHVRMRPRARMAIRIRVCGRAWRYAFEYAVICMSVCGARMALRLAVCGRARTRECGGAHVDMHSCMLSYSYLNARAALVRAAAARWGRWRRPVRCGARDGARRVLRRGGAA